MAAATCIAVSHRGQGVVAVGVRLPAAKRRATLGVVSLVCPKSVLASPHDPPRAPRPGKPQWGLDMGKHYSPAAQRAQRRNLGIGLALVLAGIVLEVMVAALPARIGGTLLVAAGLALAAWNRPQLASRDAATPVTSGSATRPVASGSATRPVASATTGPSGTSAKAAKSAAPAKTAKPATPAKPAKPDAAQAEPAPVASSALPTSGAPRQAAAPRKTPARS